MLVFTDVPVLPKVGAMARLVTKPLPKPCANDLESSQTAKSRPTESPHHCSAAE